MKIKFKLILRTENFDSSMLVELIEKDNSSIEITKYDYKEPLKHKVDKDKIGIIVDLFDKYLDIIFKGKNKFWMSISTTAKGIMMIGGGLEMKNAKIDEVISFIQLFSRDEQLLYGYMCSEEEYDKKHKLIEGSGVSWKGVSRWDFLEFLPGIHWYTIFGKELVNCIGRDKFNDLEGITYTNPKDSSIAFFLESPIDYNNDRLLELEAVEKQIGEQYFYNRDKNEYSHPESYKLFLKSFGRGY